MRKWITFAVLVFLVGSASAQFQPGPDPRSRPTSRWQPVTADVLVLQIYRIEKAPLSDANARRVDAYRGAIGKTSDPLERRDIEDKLEDLLDRIGRVSDWWVIGDTVPVNSGKPNLSWAKTKGRDRVLRVRARYRELLSKLAPGDFITTAKPYFGKHFPGEYVCRYPIRTIGRPDWWPWKSSNARTAIARPVHPIFDDAWVVQYEYFPFIAAGNKSAADVVEAAMPAVFTIITPRGWGSGFLINQSGIAITNAHVVDTAREFMATMHDGREVQGIVLGVTLDADLALVSLEGDGYEYLRLGVDREVRIGEEVFAIGTPENKLLGQTVSKGIISGVRELDGESLIQTDAPINQGNSGGPLLSIDGAVIGVVVSKMADSDNNEGLAFAIPITVALQSLPLSRSGSAP